MSVNLSPIGDDAPFIDASGNPLNAGLLYTYTAGSTTPQNTYTTSAGSIANANPIVLDSNGYPSNGSSVVSIWLTGGVSYKFVLKTSAGVTVWTRDNIVGINDTTVSVSEWVSGPAPTYVSATSFTLVGDQTSTFQVGRRLKTTNSGGAVYSTIVTSAFAALTTITVINDSGTLDAGLSAVSYGLLSSTQSSLPLNMADKPLFSAYLSASATNVTGAGANYTVICNTEIADQTNSYNNASGVFTAPLTGKYRLVARVTLDDLTTAMTSYTVSISTTTRTVVSSFVANGGSNSFNQINIVVDDIFAMTAGNTASIVVNVANGAGATADVLGSANAPTSFHGELIA
jgi:hypothetical protein